jgi:hypothetical protein
LKQLKEIIEHKKNAEKGALEVPGQVENCKKVLDPENTRSILNIVSSTVNSDIDHECLDEAVRLLNGYAFRKLTDDSISVCTYSIPGLSGTKFLPYQVWAIWFIVRR